MNSSNILLFDSQYQLIGSHLFGPLFKRFGDIQCVLYCSALFSFFLHLLNHPHSVFMLWNPSFTPGVKCQKQNADLVLERWELFGSWVVVVIFNPFNFSTLTIQFTATSDETYTCVITDTYLSSTYTSSVATISPLSEYNYHTQ